MKIMISNQQSKVKHFPLGPTPETLAAYVLAYDGLARSRRFISFRKQGFTSPGPMVGEMAFGRRIMLRFFGLYKIDQFLKPLIGTVFFLKEKTGRMGCLIKPGTK